MTLTKGMWVNYQWDDSRKGERGKCPKQRAQILKLIGKSYAQIVLKPAGYVVRVPLSKLSLLEVGDEKII